MAVQTTPTPARVTDVAGETVTETAVTRGEGHPSRWPAVPVIEVPEGWELLPAGVARTIRVHRQFIGQPGGLPFVVFDGIPGRTADIHHVEAARVLGETEFVHKPGEEWCGKTGIAEIRTTAAVLVRR